MARTEKQSKFTQLTTLFEVPWNSFVAAFLYYTLLAALALGGASARGPLVVGAYGLPPIMLISVVALRLVRIASARVAEWQAASRASAVAAH